MARPALNVRQLPVGLRAHHDRYLKRQAEVGFCSEADVVREALDVFMAALGHTCMNEADESPCPACGGSGGKV
jgi:hypothetical protein